MLEVHPPGHAIYGMREFFLHLLTITIGLLIALGLEASVEALAHRHQRIEAEATIRRELDVNRHKIDVAGRGIESELKGLVVVLNYLAARQQGKPGDLTGATINFSEGPLQDAAWRAAASTGVLSYMDYTAAEKYAVAYKEQDLYETMQQQTLDGYLQLGSFIPNGFDPAKDTVTKEQADAALPIVRQTIAHLQGMADIRLGALSAYQQALR
ncbi:MAG: hypothetical protein ABSF57_11980 [Acidobacteriaceae bacterium]|jgi:hypothetical protein